MPSPFPGMDPYLESPALWADVHTNLVTSIQAQLAPRLRPAYFVGVERRVYILSEDDPARRVAVPDLAILTGRRPAPEPPGTGATRARPAVLLAVMDGLEMGEPRLAIYEAGSRTVVAIVEVLSPANKVLSSRGREEYLSKRREVLRSNVHLVEIDLLRAGARVPTVDPLPAGDYCVHVSRTSLRPRGEFYVWTIREPLPAVPVPLRGGEVELDLGEALRVTYDRVGYDLVIDYAGRPEPPLRPDDEAWARDLVPPRRAP